MRIGLSTEADVDSRVIKKIVTSCFPVVSSFVERPHRGYGDLCNNLRFDLREYVGMDLKLVLVIADNDRRRVIDTKRKIQKEVNSVSAIKDGVVVGVAVEAIESWLLCDEKALSSALKASPPIPCQGNTDLIPFPKERLEDMIPVSVIAKTYDQVLIDISSLADWKNATRKSQSLRSFYDALNNRVRCLASTPLSSAVY